VQSDFGAYVSLSAVVSDPNGDPVTVTWKSNTSGSLGSGESLIAWISTNGSDAAQPVITATATDSNGATTTAIVQIIVWIPSDS